MNCLGSMEEAQARTGETPESLSKLIMETENGRLQWIPIGTHWVLDLSKQLEDENHWLIVEPGVSPTLRWVLGNPGELEKRNVFVGEIVEGLVEVLERRFPLESMTGDQALRATLLFLSKLSGERAVFE